MLSRLSVAALVVAVSVSGASGLAALIGDAFVKLPPPAGFCELTPRYEFDRDVAERDYGSSVTIMPVLP